MKSTVLAVPLTDEIVISRDRASRTRTSPNAFEKPILKGAVIGASGRVVSKLLSNSGFGV